MKVIIAENYLLVSGGHKANIFEKFLEVDPSPALPATLLKEASRFIVVADKAAAAKINPGEE